MQHLQQVLKDAGLPHNKKTLLKWEAEGRLVSPRSSTNTKIIRGISHSVRMYSEDQINEIVRAFSPAGTGRWAPNE
jgi:hypothetical protein